MIDGPAGVLRNALKLIASLERQCEEFRYSARDDIRSLVAELEALLADIREKIANIDS
jgi:hypothetical protein